MLNYKTENISSHILIVDDIGENLQVLGNILSKEGYDTSFALDGKQALSAIDKFLPDLILLDISMPIMDGFEVCKILKQEERTKNIPIIFLTAKTEIDNVIHGFSLGADDYVMKPFNSLELLARVRSHVDLKKSKDLILEQNNQLNDVVSQLSLKNEELKLVVAAKDKFFSIIAHDLKGPVGNLNSFLNFMTEQSDKISKENFQKNLHLLQTSSQNIKDLLENLLTWARAQRGDIEYNPDNYDILNLVNSNIHLLESSAINKSVSIINKIQNCMNGFFDYNMINTVFRNLLSNSIKYTKFHGTITIMAIELEKEIEISIQDTGVGMSKTIAEDLFRIDVKHFSTSGTNGEKGTGLGLILCKEFIDKHGGKIWAESEKEKGSTFKFLIPKFSK
ncbi:MAG: hybrid sensor histidine kinase/response regulator [Leptospiraceae bacterium]|nr:hybrid sensor histidine kinase/response regulator [Leptospiraceae bacterium]